MPRDSRAYLWDVQEAAKAIMEFVADIDLETYTSTAVIHSAVERKFEIIGEALNHWPRTILSWRVVFPTWPKSSRFVIS